ncbi:hypothetical protein KUV64_00375 [Mameliella alba]|uniref:hypothetical protein n=1 Tax=Mameliella alba TaxID=561184 RepID=UPI000B52FCFC|nr:hypothetical protein [Mameliella alba]MBY6117575.1 hypothetical protein [Mameliella alba]OWV64969.1 hypothetical protein CDZ97_08825 [Mameliella alba]
MRPPAAIAGPGDGPAPRPDGRNRNLAADIFGTAFLFITFTQSVLGGATGYLLYYTPLALICLVLLNLADPPRRMRLRKDAYVVICTVVFLACLSINGLQYAVVFTLFAALFLLIPIEPLIRNLPKYAYYAAILNVGLYYGEIILAGQLGLPFDPTVFNYGGAGRDETTYTWGFARYAGHQAEPGNFAANLAALAVLSMLGDRKPNWFHWLTVVTLTSTLSLTSVVMAMILTISILLANRLNAKNLIISVMALVGAAFLLIQVGPMIGLPTLDYLIYRLDTQGASDGSILSKGRLIGDVTGRNVVDTLIGNRHDVCDYCGYAQSLGFAFYMVFHGGLTGALAVFLITLIAWRRLGRRGLALAMVLLLLRSTFYFPQAVFIFLVIAVMPGQTSPRDRPVPAPSRVVGQGYSA